MQTHAGAVVSVQYDYATAGGPAGGGGSIDDGGVTSLGSALSLSGLSAFTNSATTTAQSFTIANSAAGWSDPLAVAQFNPALGTLEAVDVVLNGDIVASVAAENTGNGAIVFGATQSAVVALDLAGTLNAEVPLSTTDSMTLGAYDGTADFAGTSGHTDPGLTDGFFPGGTLSFAGSETDPSILAAFTGTGTYDVPISSTGTSLAQGGANLVSDLTLHAGANARFSYVYTPAAPVVSSDAVALQPTISGTAADQPATDQATIRPFSSVVITDPNIAQTETVTIALSASRNGTLIKFGGGTYNATNGVYSDIGSAAAVSAALNGLIFVPMAGEVPLGQTVTTGFTISDTDTASARATDTTTSVVAAASYSLGGKVVLHGSHDQYVIADDGGSLYIQDTVAGRDGTQVLSGIEQMVFTDGTSVFDPTGTAEDIRPALHRTPDAAGLQGWVNALRNGASEASVVVGFSDSLESRALTAGATHANSVFIPSAT